MAASSRTSAGSSDRTISILLGSSEYPRDPLNNKEFMREALSQSQKDFLAYLQSSEGFGIPKESVCDLFGSDLNFIEQHDKIGAFLEQQMVRLGTALPVDLIIFFWGHGYFVDKQFHLALKHYKHGEERTTGFPIETLAAIIKRLAQNARRYWLLDCCYADGALSAALDASPRTQAQTTVAQSPIELTKEILGAELAQPTRGSTALTAADRDNKAWVFRKDTRSLFTDLLMGALAPRDGDESKHISFQQIEQRMQATLGERLRDRTKYPDYHDQIIMPRCTDSDRSRGVVSSLPLFPLYPSIGIDPRRRVEDLLNLGKDKLACLLIETEDKNSDFQFEASAALIEHQAELEIESSLEFEPDEQVRVLGIEDAFRDWDKFLLTVKVLCRADVVVFDVTGFQPGTMLLLGIRSVVRRGVTVSTLDSPHVEAYRAELPYCLQLLNVCSNSLEGPDKDKPRDVIATKVIEGLRQERSNPHYLDLPAYDAVRRFGAQTDKYRPIPYELQVLFLCPFSSEYIKACWDASINRVFKPRLIQRQLLRAKGTVKERIRPELRRLLDRSSPQIVSQSLYEAVRRTQMCVADWTNLRPNLFFELGVRLAANRNGAVHIVADGKLKARGKFETVETWIPLGYLAV